MPNKTKILYLSPHLDDAVLSSGGLLRQLISNLPPQNITIANIFTRSLWAPGYGGVKSTDVISATRVAEDRLYIQDLGVTAQYLGYKDSSLRGYDDYSELHGNYETDFISETVRNAVQQLIGGSEFDYIFCPLAIGSHIDHVIVNKSVKYLQVDNVILYEDLPYSCLYLDDNVQLSKDYNLGHYSECVTQIDINKKVFDIHYYNSQMEAGLVEKIILHALKQGKGIAAERLWVSEKTRRKIKGGSLCCKIQ